MKDWQKRLLFVVIMMGVIAGIVALIHTVATRDCVVLEKQTNYSTKYVRGSCFVEIAPGLWIRDWEVIYYLDHIEQGGVSQ